MMAEGVRRMDELYSDALAAGRLERDSSLDLPPPPVLPLPVEVPVARPVNVANMYQVQITGSDVNVYNFAMAHLRTLPGIQSVSPQLINPVRTSYVLVAYRGDIATLAAALSARGWIVEFAGTVVKMRSASDKPPALAPPPQAPQPAATPPQQPTVNRTGDE
jgi:hypothetical protein